MMTAQPTIKRGVRGSLHVELQESPETAEILQKAKLFLCSCEVLLCVLPLVRSNFLILSEETALPWCPVFTFPL